MNKYWMNMSLVVRILGTSVQQYRNALLSCSHVQVVGAAAVYVPGIMILLYSSVILLLYRVQREIP